ncbi:MAG: tRNA epoxyqueuosine(34) reductase QueG, partial [Muribaculaceae bacterium]|nr:tRNA epoxyqueuosine(34) reductase QueG [Muribaculaceae bacterium]
EYRGELPENLELGNRIYGCDRCQQVCRHNKGAVPTTETVFSPSEKLLSLTADEIAEMTEDEYNNIFMHSAVKRAGLQQLKRNLRHLKR